MAFSTTRLLLKRQNYHPLKFFLTDFTASTSLVRKCALATPEKCSTLASLSSHGYCNIVSVEPGLLLSNFHQQTLASTGMKTCPLRVLCPFNSKYDAQVSMKYYSTNSTGNQPLRIQNKEQFKKAVKEYGATVVVFHVAISLLSLGCCYLAVTRGVNFGALMPTSSLGESADVAAEAGLFVVAYAVHKVLAPVRISITLAATPFIVRYLRKINVLKPPKQ